MDESHRVRLPSRIVPFIALLLLCAFLASTAWVVMSSLPGQPLYGLKMAFENWESLAARSPRAEADVALRHSVLRLDELQRCCTAGCGPQALVRFDTSLITAIDFLTPVPPDQQPAMQARLASLSREAGVWLDTAASQCLDNAARRQVLARVELLAHLAGGPNIAPSDLLRALQTTQQPAAVAQANPDVPLPAPIPDPTATPTQGCAACHRPPHGDSFGTWCQECHSASDFRQPTAFHSSADLTDCQRCHSQSSSHIAAPGQCDQCHINRTAWREVSVSHVALTDCQSCHSQPSGHISAPFQCSQCHTGTGITWKEVSVTHAGLTDCRSCHTQPAGHIPAPGQCSQCHTSTANWKDVVMDHTGLTDCQSCHSQPAGHIPAPGQCSQCHTSTASWKDVVVDHSGLTDCQSCHSQPPGHIPAPGQCSQCHTSTTSWKDVVVDHTGLTDCQACHTRPPGHIPAPGQCSQCHTAGTSWQDVHMDHSGLTDCQACHTQPPGHIPAPGQCSQCHTAGTSWQDVHMDHSGLTDCQACHTQPPGHIPAPGQCSQCHTAGTSWQDVHMDHSGLTDCEACHTQPPGHIPAPGQCSQCHTSTTNWKDVVMDHTGLTDCQSCHAPPGGHYPGQCSQCHDTGGWSRGPLNHTFPWNHNGAGGNCATCHPGYNYSAYTCYSCHDRAQMAEKHHEVGGFGDDCARCHPTGGGGLASAKPVTPAAAALPRGAAAPASRLRPIRAAPRKGVPACSLLGALWEQACVPVQGPQWGGRAPVTVAGPVTRHWAAPVPAAILTASPSPTSGPNGPGRVRIAV